MRWMPIMKKVFGADGTTNTGNIQDHDPPYQCGSMAEIAALIPPLQKRARRLARFRAVPSWASPNEIHRRCAWMVLRRQSRSSGAVAPPAAGTYGLVRDSREPHAKRKKGSPIAFGQRGIHNPPKKSARAQTFSVFINLLDGVRQEDLWRMAGAHGGPSPSLAVWLCSQSRGYRLPGYPLGHLGACCKGRLVPKRTAVGHC